MSTHHVEKPWVNNRIRDLLARQKVYKTRNTAATKYLAERVKQEIRSTKRNYHKQKTDNICEANPKSWSSHSRNIISDKRSDRYLSQISEIADSPTITLLTSIRCSHHYKQESCKLTLVPSSNNIK